MSSGHRAGACKLQFCDHWYCEEWWRNRTGTAFESLPEVCLVNVPSLSLQDLAEFWVLCYFAHRPLKIISQTQAVWSRKMSDAQATGCVCSCRVHTQVASWGIWTKSNRDGGNFDRFSPTWSPTFAMSFHIGPLQAPKIWWTHTFPRPKVCRATPPCARLTRLAEPWGASEECHNVPQNKSGYNVGHPSTRNIHSCHS